MKKVVSFSGGRTSAYLCHLMIDLYGRENVDFIFMDTGAEHPKTYEFIKKVNKYLGLNLTCLRGDFNQPLGKPHTYKVVDIDDCNCDLGPYTELVNKYGTPSTAGKWCSSRMKEEVHDKYCDDVYGKGNYETWLGIRADEPKRLGSIGKSEFIRYMAEISDDEKQDVLNWWNTVVFRDSKIVSFKNRRSVKVFFDVRFNLEIPEHLGNCVFCFKKSNLKLAAAQRDEPELYMQWLDMVEGAKERPEQERESRHIMYRGKQSLQSLIATFDGSTGDAIKARMRGAKHLDTGSCSESCEVFSD